LAIIETGQPKAADFGTSKEGKTMKKPLRELIETDSLSTMLIQSLREWPAEVAGRWRIRIAMQYRMMELLMDDGWGENHAWLIMRDYDEELINSVAA
jgi:hypothetical protein